MKYIAIALISICAATWIFLSTEQKPGLPNADIAEVLPAAAEASPDVDVEFMEPEEEEPPSRTVRSSGETIGAAPAGPRLPVPVRAADWAEAEAAIAQDVPLLWPGMQRKGPASKITTERHLFSRAGGSQYRRIQPPVFEIRRDLASVKERIPFTLVISGNLRPANFEGGKYREGYYELSSGKVYLRKETTNVYESIPSKRPLKTPPAGNAPPLSVSVVERT